MNKKVTHQYYSNIPCQGTDCVFYQGEYEEIHDYESGVDCFGKWHEPFRSIWHGHHCAKTPELCAIRKEVYDKADKAATECYTSEKYVKPWIQAGKKFDEIKKGWTELKCPFYRIEE